jgi:hypothetical protein
MTRLERKRIWRTHAQAGVGGDLCHGCWQAAWRIGDLDHPDLVYAGGWVRRGLIEVPAKRRAS